jgi:hypothetical protein
MHISKKDAKELTNPLWKELWNNLRLVLERLRLVVMADEHNLSVYNEDVAIL